jgi:hypothetical protein
MSDRVHQPPPYSTLVATYKADPGSVHLRLGQWFINKYMPECMDGQLYVSNDTEKTLRIISTYYQHYQWEY